MAVKKDNWKIEEARRLSNSALWGIQRNYFHSKGLDAWKGEVPFYISSNCFIANRYAHFVFRLIQEEMQRDPHSNLAFQIVELGAGTGKFSYYFLKSFLGLIKSSQIAVKFCYTLTDFSEKIMQSMQNNASFLNLKKELASDQQIEFIVWDFETTKESIVKSAYIPIIIANYVFDCIQQDKFYLENKILYEVQLALNKRYLSFEVASPKTLKDLDFKESKIAVDPAAYYKDPKLNSILETYLQKVTTAAEFSFPVGFFNFISLLDDVRPYYMLVGDKGLSHLEDFEFSKKRELMSYDGCYSFLLNFDAMNQYFDQIGGGHLGTEYIYAFSVHLYGNPLAKEIIQTKKTDFNELFSQFGPKEYLSICQEYQASTYRFKLDSIIDFIKLSNYDPDAYGVVHDRLIELIPAINEYNKANILLTLEKVENNIYMLGSIFDTYNLLGIFFQLLGDLLNSERLFKKSIDILGSSGPAHHNLGMLYSQKKDKNTAIFHLEKSLEIEQKNTIAKRKLSILKGSFWQRIIIPLSKVALIISILFSMYLFIRFA